MTAQKLAPFLLTALILPTGCAALPEEESVYPGINADFLDPDLDVDSMVQMFEVESREIAASRTRIADALGIREDMSVADIGAGTGLFMEPLAASVGTGGTVYAVDVAPPFVQHLQDRAQSLGLNQVTTVLCTERSVELASSSVDLAFICDVYHHFEYPKSTMATVYDALRPGGTLVVVDFNNGPDIRGGWALEHIRASKEKVTSEIQAAGFEFVEEVAIEGMTDNYFLRFRKN